MKNTLGIGFAVLLAISLVGGVRASAQDTVDSVLRPPKGSAVAIVVFEDLQCPMCRRTAPLVEQASKTYKIPSSGMISPCPCTTGRIRRP